ncbi:putative protein FAM47D [Notolabrus celidotus]|uniref:putative protein FAM47D n=1 Tax=Notolabrus celidotus TaxID=1203425 RepID=UPI00148F9266|nr:putative protein FAM47D [Notolabrus celidotus]XP_034547802.1 putative protein FAM47D [Notolabrus celidotus]
MDITGMDINKTSPLFPWYKERLKTRFLNPPKNKVSLVCSFVNTGLDDFSDCPSLLSGAQRGVSPVLFHSTQNKKSNQKQRQSISKEHACFSKQMIQKQLRKEYIAAVEEKLTKCPLTMYPHYKDHMTPELFHKVASILDPEMCVNDASRLPTPTEHHVAEDNDKNCKEE